jgi:hypothetical protein
MEPHHRHRIVSAPTRSELSLRLRHLLAEGWEPIGEISLAKSTYPDEPAYYCIAMREKTCTSWSSTSDIGHAV